MVYRLLSPGSEWRLHRQWYARSALPDLLGTDEVIDSHALYARLDRLLEQNAALFDHLTLRWRDLFNVSFDVLLYDLTSTYFEINPPLDEGAKLLAQDQELYVFAESRDRVVKERPMRRRQLKWLWRRLRQLSTMKLPREALLMKLSAAQSKAPAAWRLVKVELAIQGASFGFWLNRKNLREARRREGRYLLRTNLIEAQPAKLWEYYLHLVTVEEAFRRLKGDLAIRPIFHQHKWRIEAHIFIAFLAYCVHVTFAHRLKHLASGLSTRSVLEKSSAGQMIDVHIPTTDSRELSLTRYSQPELKLLLVQLKRTLPPQLPPKITAG